MSWWLPIALLLGAIIIILILALISQDRDYRRHSPPGEEENEEM